MTKADALACMATLSAKGWLSEVPVEFQTEILKIAEWRRVEAGQSIMVAGDTHGGVFGLARGSVAIFTSASSPDAPILTIIQPGFWFGEAVLITGKPRLNSAVANTECELAYLPLIPLRRLLTIKPEWWRDIAWFSMRSSVHVLNAAADLLIRDTVRRSAAILLRLAGCRFAEDGSALAAEVHVTQDALAAMANLSRSTMNTVLARLADEGMISLHNRRIIIKDTAALRSVADDV